MANKSPLPRETLFLLACILLGITGITAFMASKFVPGKLVVVITAGSVLGLIIALVFLARRLKNLQRFARSLAITLPAAVLGSYAILFGVIFFFQDTIGSDTSIFFQPQPLADEAANALTSPQIEAIDLETPDGARLRGWLLDNAQSASAPLLIYFDGSGSESSKMIPYLERLKGWSVALVNYRGFGLSTGTPSQNHAFADAALLYDTFSTRPGINSQRIVAMGYSLGTGVAVYLSAQRPVAGTILVAPYDYMTLIGLKHPVEYAPLASIMKPYFDSIARAPAISTPLLCLIGSADPVVPPELSFRLVNQWGGKTTVKTYQGEDHSLLLHANSSWDDIAAFLQNIEKN